MVVKSNIPALNAHRNMGINNNQLSKNLEKLSSGYKINRAADDAAGLAISEKMRSQIRGLEKAEENTENAINLVQTAEGGMNEMHAILHRLRELAVQASNGTYTDDDRAQILLETNSLVGEIDRIAQSTHYNGIKLLDGTLGSVGLDALVGGEGSGGPNADVFADGSIVAYAKYLSQFGFAFDTTNVGGSSALNVGVEIDNIDPSIQGETISLIVTSGTETGDGHAQLSMQVGTTTYVGSFDSGVYTFKDASGNTMAELKQTVPSPGTGELSGNGVSGVISNITLHANPTTLYKSDAGTAVGDDLIAGNPAYAHLTNTQFATTASTIVFQIGANGGDDQRVTLSIPLMSCINLGSFEGSGFNATGTLAGISVETGDHANDAIDVIDAAVNQISSVRATLGALQNRLEHTLNSLNISIENLSAAESVIRDTDMAKEMMKFTQNSILVQASQAMLAQASQLPQGILSLLG